jgi:serine/threonine-protein kinase HipA
MAIKSSKRQDLEVHLGSSGQVVGRLHLDSGKRSAFSYDERWLRDSRFFTLSSDLHWQVPPLVELSKVLQAAHALEKGTESTQDLQYLLGLGTSLGGARPKSTVRDTDDRLALGKFPSQADQRDVIRGEVLAMHLAAKAGIKVARARVELINGTAVAIIRRFDRTDDGGRIPYISAATMLQSDGRGSTHAYTELVDALLQEGANPIADMHELWRRLVFNFLICNTDDHLRNTGFLYDARNHGWRLSPAFDLNPMPGDRRESKTWLTEDSGSIDSRDMLMEGAGYFRLDADEAAAIWAEVAQALDSWRMVAKGLGMRGTDLVDFEPAFE